MLQFDNITTHTSDFPPRRSFLGTAEEAAAIPSTHQDQVFFLNQEASHFIRAYLEKHGTDRVG